jgi:hypothetical protein
MAKYVIISLIAAAIHAPLQFWVLAEYFWSTPPLWIELFMLPAVAVDSMLGSLGLAQYIIFCGPLSLLLGVFPALAVFMFDQRAGFFADDVEEVV